MRRWIRLVVTVGAAEQHCSELVLMGLARARFCELAQPLQSKTDLFLMGCSPSWMQSSRSAWMCFWNNAGRARNQSGTARQNSTLRPLYRSCWRRIRGVGGIERLAKQLKLPKTNRLYLVSSPAVGAGSHQRRVRKSYQSSAISCQ